LLNLVIFRIITPVIKYSLNTADVAQLVRALDCGPGGRGFETHHSPQISKKVGQIADQKHNKYFKNL